MTPDNDLRLRQQARRLGKLVETLDGLTPAQRCDLRHVRLLLEEIADDEQALSGPAQRPGLVRPISLMGAMF